jgi:hypothetical protein
MSEKLEQSCGGVIFALKEIAAKSSFHNLEKIAESTIQFRHYVDSANPIRQIHFFAESTSLRYLTGI